jgi:hypothetical protein
MLLKYENVIKSINVQVLKIFIKHEFSSQQHVSDTSSTPTLVAAN